MSTRTVPCTEGVTRGEAFQPCDKPAVAYRRDPESNEPYPVCAYHCRGEMVPLTKPYWKGEEQ